MKKISDIYAKYKIPPTLQEHMLRVASVANCVLENLDISLDKEKVIKAALIHDMGNILKMDFYANIPINSIYSLEQKDYWNNIKKEFKNRYGENTNIVNLKISKEIGVEEDVIDLLNDLRFEDICDIANSSLEKQILKYADLRVGLYGIVSLSERMNDANVRYSGVFSDKLIVCAKRMENQIFAKCKIKPEEMNDNFLELEIEKLKNFEI